ncbi:hypothetical protein PHISCL_03840 [Aspergillus sclerotialis]|uniref:Uncharacterized protein n=1 Tax=Aspergillus sclerotialis TaxID=2070753 RepID=A0A3A2ZKS2_9EURO|nr:hypothetical protein PHISCL_03840 [Aspergillus sclerotialis]
MGEYVTNHVAMQGNGSYNSNSALQRAAMMEALPLFNGMITPGATSSIVLTVVEDYPVGQNLTVVEYGVSQGANSVVPLKHILEQATKSQTPNTRLAVTLALCDRPSNDFTALAQTIDSIKWPESVLRKAEIFPFMSPRSFFEPILPNNSADVGFSLAALHHLDRVSARSPQSGNDTTRNMHDENRREVFAAQARHDLQKFLQLRAGEFKPGASLVLAFVGASTSGVANYLPLVESCKIAMAGMIQDGTIPARVLECFEVLVHDRSISEVEEVLKAESERWAVESFFEKMIQHPAVTALHAADDGRTEKSLSSEEYAQVVVDWEMAVIGGYFTSAVGKAMGVGAWQQERLLAEWTRRTVDEFLRSYRDAVVECCFILVKVRRK